MLGHRTLKAGRGFSRLEFLFLQVRLNEDDDERFTSAGEQIQTLIHIHEAHDPKHTRRHQHEQSDKMTLPVLKRMSFFFTSRIIAHSEVSDGRQSRYTRRSEARPACRGLEPRRRERREAVARAALWTSLVR